MLSIGRCRTTDGLRTVIVEGADGWILPPGSPGVLDLLRAALRNPGGLAGVLEQRWPGWRSERVDVARDLALPLEVTEVWAAGVTYERSRVARVGESDTPDIYQRVYTADRPEIFLKDNGRRTVGPGEPIGVRGDSRWSVPEPELALLLDSDGTVLGYTVGNDVTARDVEAANPLYLPQAKMFTAGCAVGPVVVPAGAVDPTGLGVTCRILRDGAVRWEASTSTARLVRRLDELVGWLLRYNTIPAGTLYLTGTGLVPPDDVSLGEGDLVEIEIDGIGLLRNPVRVLAG